jgi:hypothetical protein
MIDPLGPDPTDPVLPARQVAEIVSEFETPGSLSPLRPKVRYANYDSPEAQLRKEPPHIEDRRPEASARNQASPRAVILPRAEAPPRIQEAPLPIAPTEPIASAQPAQSRRPKTEFRPASTALARPMPPKPTRLERAMSVARTVLPIVGKMLPLLEGNVVGAASNLFANRPMHEVDLKPLEESISRLQSDHRALAFHSGEQKRALQRLEDDFATLQDAVQKNAADQAELIEHVAKLAKRTSSFMRLVTILLVISILFTVLLCVRIAYMIRF